MITLLIVTGPPGAGKSTVARLVADRFDRSLLLEGDAFFQFVKRGAIIPWLPEADSQNEVVTQAAAAAAGRYAVGGFTTVYDGLVGPWFLPTFLQATGINCVEYVVLFPSAERCVDRIGTRLGHGFTDEAATRHMHRQFAEANMDGRHVLIDPPEQPDKVADLVMASLDSGLLSYPDSP